MARAKRYWLMKSEPNAPMLLLALAVSPCPSLEPPILAALIVILPTLIAGHVIGADFKTTYGLRA